MKYELIWEFQNVVLMSKSSPLASMEGISYSDLKGFIEITHGDLEVPFLSNSEVKNNEFSDIINKRIFIYERGSQFDLLSNLPSAYMQASPIPQELQDKYGLVQKKCKEDERIYKDVLIYRNNYQFTDMDKEFVKELKLAAKLVSG